MPEKDFSQIALGVVQRATDEAPKPEPKTARQENSRKGGLKGGATRAANLTAEQRSEIAKKAAQSRWSEA